MESADAGHRVGPDGGVHREGTRVSAPLYCAHDQAEAARHPRHLEARGRAMSESSHDYGALPLSLRQRIDEAGDRFEDAWRAGTPPRIEDYLDGWREPERTALLNELVPLDADYRRAHGEAPRPEHYIERFPTLDRDELAAALAEAAPLPPDLTVTVTAPVAATESDSRPRA